jgi:hypothetical protein
MSLYKLEGVDLTKYPTKDFSKENYEQRIEEILEGNEKVLFDEEPVLWIGRQVATSYGKKADLIGLDRNGGGIIVELKRGITPRDIIAQALEYSTWFSQLREDEIEELAVTYFKKRGSDYSSIAEAFSDVFSVEGSDLPGLNSTQRIGSIRVLYKSLQYVYNSLFVI